MKKLIHTDNYESFYLDYLEGTLSDSERIAFEEFLAAHPELQVDEELIFLDDAPETLSMLEKELLKKNEERIISAENFDYFAIGSIEKVLTKEETALLEAYLLNNPAAQKTLEEYQATRLQPVAVAYPDKEALKEKEVAFVSWKLIVGIASAAAVLLLFFQLWNTNSKPGSELANNSKDKKSIPGSNTVKSPQVIPTNGEMKENQAFVADKNRTSPDRKNAREPKSVDTLRINTPLNKDGLANNTPQHHPTILPQVKDNKEPVAPSLNNNDVEKAPDKDLASHTSSSSNMKNPIPVITSAISEKTNTPVDFKTGKATETQKGGFFVKIGKFEISHKSSKRK